MKYKIHIIILTLFIPLFLLKSPLIMAGSYVETVKTGMKNDFDNAASQLAQLLASDPEMRNFLYQQTQASIERERKLDLANTLTRASQSPTLSQSTTSLNNISQIISAAQDKMRSINFSDSDIGVDIYFPVKEHREKWKGESDMLVAITPPDIDDSEYAAITAYSVLTGEKLNLDPVTPPDTPTLVIGIKERLPADLSTIQPVPLTEVNNDNFAIQVTRQYLGIPQLRILNDHEPWTRGDPEIYVLIGQSERTSPQVNRINMDMSYYDINEENRWYCLGDDQNALLYFYFDENYSDASYVHVMEHDGGSVFTLNASVTYGGSTIGLSWLINDGDDSLGSRSVNKNDFPLSGYTTRSTGDAEFRIDIDLAGSNNDIGCTISSGGGSGGSGGSGGGGPVVIN